MRFLTRFAVPLAVLLFTSALYGQTAAPALPAPSPEDAIAPTLSQPAAPDQPDLTPGFGFEYRSCTSERTACFASCPPSGPEKVECGLACQCQYIMCMGGSCTQ